MNTERFCHIYFLAQEIIIKPMTLLTMQKKINNGTISKSPNFFKVYLKD